MRIVYGRHTLLVSVGAAEQLENGQEQQLGCGRKTLLSGVVAPKVLDQRELVLLVHVCDEHRGALLPLLDAEQQRRPPEGNFAAPIAPVGQGSPEDGIDDLVRCRCESGHDHGQRRKQLREEVLVVRRPANDAGVRVVVSRILVGEAGLRHPRVPLPHCLGRPATEANSKDVHKRRGRACVRLKQGGR